MKIYHTETQADYDALMIELESEGITWHNGQSLTKDSTHIWNTLGHRTCIRVTESIAFRALKSFYEKRYPNTPITKYKEKADEKMRFTKENVLDLTDKWIENKTVSFQDLQNQIKELDDTPEKVVVPKHFDDWYKEIESKYQTPDSAKTFALWKLCQQGFGCSFEDIRGKKIPYETDLGEWFENKVLAIDAVLNGYTIEPEKLYCIPLPHLETTDGIQQVLSKSRNGNRYFASRPDKKLKQRYTKEELEQVPEIYKSYATPIEGEM